MERELADLQERYTALKYMYEQLQNKNHNLMADLMMMQERIRHLEALIHGGVVQ